MRVGGVVERGVEEGGERRENAAGGNALMASQLITADQFGSLHTQKSLNLNENQYDFGICFSQYFFTFFSNGISVGLSGHLKKMFPQVKCFNQNSIN